MGEYWEAIKIAVPHGMTIESVWAEAVKEYEAIRPPGGSNRPFIEIDSPCGEHIVYKTAEDVPLVDTICPCGSPDHMIVNVEFLPPINYARDQ